MIDYVWLICLFEMVLYPVTLVVGLILDTPGKQSIGNAYWTQSGRFVRNATWSEKHGLERGINASSAPDGRHPFASVYGSALTVIAASLIVFLASIFMFKDAPYKLPWPVMLIGLALHSFLHGIVVRAYCQSHDKTIKRLATAMLFYKLFVALGMFAGIASEDIGSALMVLNSEYEAIYVVYMKIILATYPLLYIPYTVLYFKRKRHWK